MLEYPSSSTSVLFCLRSVVIEVNDNDYRHKVWPVKIDVIFLTVFVGETR